MGTFAIDSKQDRSDTRVIHKRSVGPVPLTAESDWVTRVALEMFLN
jgi:hypothetical protein